MRIIVKNVGILYEATRIEVYRGMNMEQVIMILTPMEMLLVNLFVIHKCSQVKYNKLWTFLGMGLSICVLMFASYLISSHGPDFGSGNGLFIFSGFLFMIPILLLYRVSVVKMITIACFAWVYTFMLFVMSVRLGYAMKIESLSIHTTVFLLQTVLYIVTFRPFSKILESRFIIVLKNTGKEETIALMWVTMMWFWTVFIFNLSFAYPEIRTFQILTLPTLTLCILSNFRYIHLQVNSNQTIQDLENIAYRDELTQLRTRVILKKDAEDLITRKMPFHLIFLDLDRFKSINDRYGHRVGDQYLAFFAYEVKRRIGNRGGFYRVAGDEFVCVFPEEGLEAFLDAINTLPETMPETQVRFLGFSYGIATYPQNGDTADSLLEYADNQMYEMKRTMKQVEKSS